MPSSTLTLFKDFAERIGKGAHDLSTHTIKVALTNIAPDASTQTQLSDIAQIAPSGGYADGAGGGYAVSGAGYTEVGGVGTFTFADLTITATGGSIGPFRYPVIYNDSATAPTDALIGYLDYGAELTLADTQFLTLQVGALGVLKVTA